MNDFLLMAGEFPEETCPPGTTLLRQGERLGRLYVLVEGKVEIVKNGQRLCEVAEPGSVFGELSILLECYQNASVRTLVASRFRVIEDGEGFLKGNPEACMVLTRMLARRLARLDACFADLRRRIDEMQAEAAGGSEEP